MIWAPLDSLLETMHRRVCPLYSFDDANRAQIVGSAVPFDSHGFRFLITATHVLLRQRQRLSIPVFTMTKAPRLLTGRRIAWEHQPGVSPDLDLSLVELTDEEAEDIETTYQFASPKETSEPTKKTPGVHYLIAGYPASRNRFRSPRHYPSSRATHLVTGDIQAISPFGISGKTDETHFALAFPFREVPKTGGGNFTVPRTAGMSGGGVWRMDIDIQRRLATSPSLVGIGIEHHRFRGVFVATRVQQAIPLFQDLVRYVNAGVWPEPEGA